MKKCREERVRGGGGNKGVLRVNVCVIQPFKLNSWNLYGNDSSLHTCVFMHIHSLIKYK